MDFAIGALRGDSIIHFTGDQLHASREPVLASHVDEIAFLRT